MGRSSKIGLTDIAVIFRMKFFPLWEKNIMDRLFFNSRYKRGDVLIMIIKKCFSRYQLFL